MIDWAIRRGAMRPAVAALIALCCLAAIALMLPPDLLRACTAAGLFWSFVPIGTVGLLMMIRLIPGAWDFELQAIAEATCLLQPVAWLVCGAALIRVTAYRDWAGDHPLEGFKAIYLGNGFLAARTIAFLVLNTILAWLLIGRRGAATSISIIGLMLYVLLSSTFAVDWLMAQDLEFHASGFGLYLLAIQLDIALAFITLIRLRSGRPTRRAALLGALLFAGLLLWAYLAFMQFFILWSGNLPVGVSWYQARGDALGQGLLWAIALLHGVPLILLLFGPIRANPHALTVFCVSVLFGKALEIAWIILMPSSATEGWLTFGVFALVLGLAIALLQPILLEFRIRHRLPERREAAA